MDKNQDTGQSNQTPKPQIATPSKKSKRSLFIAIGAIIAIIIISAISTVAFLYYQNETSTDSNSNTETSTTQQKVESNDPLDVSAITSILTDSSTSEYQTSNTNDSQTVSDDTGAIDVIGGSVNENNLE